MVSSRVGLGQSPLLDTENLGGYPPDTSTSKGGVTGPKKSLLSTTYPLHSAAKEGNARMVAMLLKEGADATQKNSSGRTAVQVAQKRNKAGSHAPVISALAGGRAPASAARLGGA